MLETLRSRVSKLIGRGFVRNVGVLVGGTAFAQALMVLILPVLTRLYSPEDFAVLAVYASILGIFSGIACLRFEIAIPIPETDEEAASLFLLALTSSAIISGTVAFFIFAYPEKIVELTGQPGFAPYLWLLPLGIWFSGSYGALQYWATRQNKFTLIARTRLSQAGSSAIVQIGSGLLGNTPFGLLFGHMINSGAGALALAVSIWRTHRKTIFGVRSNDIVDALRQYHRFPTYSTLEALANGASIQLPILIIAAFIAGPEVGFLMVAMRIMAAPLRLIGGAISQVFLASAPEALRAGRLDALTSQVIFGLIKTGVGPLLYIGVCSPFVFPLVFGPDWGRAGVLVSWMTPWLIFQFLASPISMALHVNNQSRIALALQILGLLIRVGVVFLAASFIPDAVSEAYSLSGLVFYLIYFAVILRAVGLSFMGVARSFIRCWGVLLFWVALGVGTVYLSLFVDKYMLSL